MTAPWSIRPEAAARDRPAVRDTVMVVAEEAARPALSNTRALAVWAP
jgi:hypothetical protein